MYVCIYICYNNNPMNGLYIYIKCFNVIKIVYNIHLLQKFLFYFMTYAF